MSKAKVIKEVVPKMGKWLYKETYETVGQFVHRLPPSRTTVDASPWICIHHQHEAWEPPTIPTPLEEEFNRRVTKRLLDVDNTREVPVIDMESVTPIFHRHNYHLGKWVVFVSRDDIDEAWEKVCRALLHSQTGLGCGIAKVSTATPESDLHAVCIYTSNFNNAVEVKRTARLIRSEAGLLQQLKYKPEAATQLDLYVDNDRWGARPTSIYATIRDNSTVLMRRAWGRRKVALYGMLEAGVFREM
eukprot:Sspe_Gene.24957::Locus_9957_Transcript_1_1_Confidence_1.000_Length_855::g.24957::m.24957